MPAGQTPLFQRKLPQKAIERHLAPAQIEPLPQKRTMQFYAQYTQARRDVFAHLKQQHPERSELALLTHTQQLLDRFIFICFCEDTGDLLPEKTFRKLIQRTQESVAFSNQYGTQRIWAELKAFFGAMNTGLNSHHIPGFNGELFKPDPAFDTLRIEDAIFLKLAQLTEYDFQSELNVNILGHIFEQSLNDLEELRAEIRGEPPDRKQSKRKKEGIFYTPEYITRYIVEQAIGGWLEDRRQELGWDALPELTPADEAWLNSTAKKKQPNPQVAQQIAFWEAYLECLKRITVLDPACGSGAFLTQAFDYLRREGERVNRELNRLGPGEQLGLFSRKTWDKAILRNNLFGVDLNFESVEITKLALWLKTAKKDDQLAALKQNIKCGNSLIDDPAAAGDKAFRWDAEFPEIMARGGFDVIIGNPPYVVLTPQELKAYRFVKGNYNTYVAFFEKALQLVVASTSRIGLIVPATWFSGDTYSALREYLLQHVNLTQLIKLPYDVFNAYIDTVIVIIKNSAREDVVETYQFDNNAPKDRIAIELFEQIPKTAWLKYGKIFSNGRLLNIGEKVWFAEKNVKLGSICKVNRGTLPPKADALSKTKTDKFNLKWCNAQIFRYVVEENRQEGEVFIDYHALRENKPFELFTCEKLLARQLMSRQFRMNLTYSNSPFAFKKNLYAIYANAPQFHLKYLLALLNSKLFSFCQVNFNASLQRDDFPAFSLEDLKQFPIPCLDIAQQQPFIEKADNMLALNQQRHAAAQKFLRFLAASYQPKHLSTKLETFETLSFAEFTAELAKQKVVLTKKDEFALLDVFEAQKACIGDVKTMLAQTDQELDRMIYQLYGLTAAEVQCIESSLTLRTSPPRSPSPKGEGEAGTRAARSPSPFGAMS